ncbi:MAG TPA: NAD(P)H-binding protein [Paludibacter sp.]|nr:NAD(P)H-binding protein [Paludibacter sp.]
MKKAIVIGGTGMVGTQLIKQLIEDKNYSEVVSLVRRASGISDTKLNEQVIDFDQPDSWKAFVTSDVLFSTLGTTIARAKTKDAQYKVDFTYQYNVAEIAAANGVPSYVLVSSAGATSKSNVFYSNMKGKLEDAVKLLPFKVISIIRPGQLAGDRTEKRTTEKIALSVMYGLNKIGLLQRYKPIQGWEVAQAMIHAADKQQSGSYTLNEVFDLAK